MDLAKIGCDESDWFHPMQGINRWWCYAHNDNLVGYITDKELPDQLSTPARSLSYCCVTVIITTTTIVVVNFHSLQQKTVVDMVMYDASPCLRLT
jgi:hypothetical protein